MPYVTEQNLTDVVQQRWKDIPDPRLREVMQAAIKHLHAFVRVKEPLIVAFKKMPAGTKAPHGEVVDQPFYVVNYDFVLERAAVAAE